MQYNQEEKHSPFNIKDSTTLHEKNTAHESLII